MFRDSFFQSNWVSNLLTLVLLLKILTVHSQTTELKGVLADGADASLIPFGIVLLQDSMDLVVAHTISNEKGEFSIKAALFPNQLFLKIYCTGYRELKMTISDLLLQKSGTGTILLQKEVMQLKEVNTSTKGNFKRMFDRTIFTINTEKIARVTTIFDVLKTLPGVTTDELGNMNYRGSNPNLYLNNLFNYMYPDLQMIQVEDLAEIELLDANLRNGNTRGGIMNIKLKDNLPDGLRCIAQLDNESTHFKDLNKSYNSFNLNYKKGKLIFFNTLSYDHTTDISFDTTRSITFSDPGSFNSFTNSFYKNTGDFLYTVTGMNFSWNKRTRIQLSGTSFSDSQVNFSKLNSLTTLSDTVYENYVENDKTTSHSNKHVVNLNFYTQTDSLGKDLTVNCKLLNQQAGANYQYDTKDLLTEESFSSMTLNDSKQTAINASLIYHHPVNSRTRWNCAWNGNLALNPVDRSMNYDTDHTVNLPYSSFTNNTSSEQNVSFRWGTLLKKWKFDGGITARYATITAHFTRYNLNSADTLLLLKRTFLNYFPSATIVYYPDSSQEIRISYARTSQLPAYYDMCDFVKKWNTHFWTTGNASLKPSDYHNFYLGYAFHQEKWNLNADIFQDLTYNKICRIIYTLDATTRISKPGNGSFLSTSGIDLSYWRSVQRFNINLSSRFFRTQQSLLIRENIMNGADLSSTPVKSFYNSFSVSAAVDFKINKLTSIFFYFDYSGKEITAQGYSSATIHSSLQVASFFLNKHLLLTLGVRNLFDNLVKHQSYGMASYNAVITTSHQLQYGSYYDRCYFFTLRYNYSFTRKK